MKPREAGDTYRSTVHVVVAIKGVPIKVTIDGKAYILKAYKQRKGRWKDDRAGL